LKSKIDFSNEEFEIYSLKLQDIIPLNMFSNDITKMDELKKILKIYYEKFKNSESYKILKVDIAIFIPFWRLSISKGFTQNYLPMFSFLGSFILIYFIKDYGIVTK
jgi:hypothetical protein